MRITIRLALPFLRARCPRCGAVGLPRLRAFSRLDLKERSSFRTIIGRFGAPIRFCRRCRLQFHDWRF